MFFPGRPLCSRPAVANTLLGRAAVCIAAGIVAAETEFAELGAIITGKAPGRQSPDAITIADLTGTGVQDTAIATLARKRSLVSGAGTDFSN